MPRLTSKNKTKTIQKKTPAGTNTRNLLVFGAVGLIVLAIIVFTLTRPQPQSLNAARLGSDPGYGPASAKVTIIEYGDFGCTTCRAWEKAGVLKQILAVYGDKIHFVWKDLPIITSASPKAAEAGQCSFDQDKFWEYHDLLYAKAPALSSADLKAYAAQLGLDQTRFNTCLDSSQDAAKVTQSTNEGHQYGFNATPAFLVNGQKLLGPPSFETLKALIDPLLNAGS